MLVGVLIGLQMLSTLYYDLYLAPFLVVVALVALHGPGVARRRSVISGLLAGGVVGGALLLPYVPAYAELRRVVGVRDLKEVALYSAQFTDYVAAPAFSTMYGWTLDIGGNERQLFPSEFVRRRQIRQSSARHDLDRTRCGVA
jgi:hypothetical protein